MNMPLKLKVGLLLISVLFLLALGSLFIHNSPLNTTDVADRLCEPSPKHWLGCDLYGGDLLTAVMSGARTSLAVALVTVTICMSMGIVFGLVSGFFGGWIDLLIMRLVDVLMAFPGILLAMSLAALLGPSMSNIIIAISITGWTSFARLVRGQVLSLREQEYILAIKALGAKTPRILFLHLLPNVWSPLLVTASFSLSGVILVEASLSFLGLGASDVAPSWGGLLEQGRSVLIEAPRLSMIPGLLIMLVVLGFNFVGDALRDLWDPSN